jgi:hypothetical protein
MCKLFSNSLLLTTPLTYKTSWERPPFRKWVPKGGYSSFDSGFKAFQQAEFRGQCRPGKKSDWQIKC